MDLEALAELTLIEKDGGNTEMVESRTARPAPPADCGESQERISGKDMRRRLRRHHRFRMRRRAERLLRCGLYLAPRGSFIIEQQARRRGDTYSICSGPMCCGNPRRVGYRTRPEELALRAETEMRRRGELCD